MAIPFNVESLSGVFDSSRHGDKIILRVTRLPTLQKASRWERNETRGKQQLPSQSLNIPYWGWWDLWSDIIVTLQMKRLCLRIIIFFFLFFFIPPPFYPRGCSYLLLRPRKSIRSVTSFCSVRCKRRYLNNEYNVLP